MTLLKINGSFRNLIAHLNFQALTFISFFEMKHTGCIPFSRRGLTYDDFTISSWMGVSGQRHAPAALYPRGKYSRHPLYWWTHRAGLNAEA
jgi:hypothetical protein